MSAMVTKYGILDMQVCVPTAWDDEQVLAFAASANPCGTTNGWQVRQQGADILKGSGERVFCADRDGHVHIMLEA